MRKKKYIYIYIYVYRYRYVQNWQTGGSQIIENLRNEKGCPYKTDQSSRKEQNKKAAK